MTRIVAVLSMMLAAQTAFGQCTTVVNHRQVVCATPVVTVATPVVVQEVITPIAVPVLVPSTVFQYLPALQPVATPVAVAPVQSQASSQDIDAMIRTRVAAIMREQSGDAGPPTLIVPAELAPAPAPQQPVGDITQRVANLLGSKSCVTCHTAGTGSPLRGNVTLFTKNGDQLIFQPSATRRAVADAVTPAANGLAAMPPNGPVLAAEDRDLLRQWAEQR